MLDLKTYLDAVNAAHDDVQRIAHNIDELLKEGSDESKAEALGMRPALEEAESKHAEAVTMYELMQKANRPNDVARNFVPVSSTSISTELETQPGMMKRSAYDEMSHAERSKFIRAGGKIED